jgi:hypothetical protein
MDGGAKDERQKGVCDGWRGDGPQALAGKVALGCVVATREVGCVARRTVVSTKVRAAAPVSGLLLRFTSPGAR